MIVLGISGGPHVHPDEAAGVPYADGYWHDAAACVVVDGRLVSAPAEERHTRVKHTSLFPTHAVRAALADAEATARDVDAVAVYFTEAYWRRYLALVRHHLPDHPAGEPRDLLQAALARAGGEDLAHAPLEFVDHHLAHGFAALHRAGRAADDCLLVTLDGAGDAESGRVVRVRPGGRLRTVWTVPLGQSLGGMYLHVTRHLGLGQFDEYKVMGLAALGDPGALRDRLAMVSVDGPEWYAIRWSFTQRLERLLPARRREDPVRDVHADVAACVQDALERAVLKVVRHAHDLAPADVLCLSGGVAHNAALNGRLQREAPVDRVLVPFAADDSGCALGAALARAHARAPGPRRDAALRSPAAAPVTPYLGTAVPADAEGVVLALKPWADHVELTSFDDPHPLVDAVAHALADGAFVGVARGRAEFGPRALGNRSILAPPAPADVRDRLNAVVKEREAFRPFAPVVGVEDAEEYFELAGPATDHAFMSYAVPVRPHRRDALAAVTHVDGTARVQVVTAEQNPFLRSLLRAFGRLHGVPGPGASWSSTTSTTAWRRRASSPTRRR